MADSVSKSFNISLNLQQDAASFCQLCGCSIISMNYTDNGEEGHSGLFVTDRLMPGPNLTWQLQVSEDGFYPITVG